MWGRKSVVQWCSPGPNRRKKEQEKIVEEGVMGREQLHRAIQAEEEIHIPQPNYPSVSQCTVKTPCCASAGGCSGDAEYLAE